MRARRGYTGYNAINNGLIDFVLSPCCDHSLELYKISCNFETVLAKFNP